MNDHADNVSVRAVFLMPSSTVLLMRIAGQAGELWITPGGRIRAGEKPLVALAREIQEETGQVEARPESEIWVRHGTFTASGRRLPETERFFLIRSGEFEPSPAAMEPAEHSRLRESRWWSIRDLVASNEHFVPRRLVELLLDLQHNGCPPHRLETGE